MKLHAIFTANFVLYHYLIQKNMNFIQVNADRVAVIVQKPIAHWTITDTVSVLLVI
ncbi:MAG: hypothetical protein ACT4ON_14585 [Bacteroidota bacterium]